MLLESPFDAALAQARALADNACPAEAEAVLREALARWRDGDAPRDRARLLLALGQALRELQHDQRAAPLLAEALVYAPAAEQDADLRARVATALSACLITLGVPEQAAEQAAVAQACLPRLRDPLLRLQVLHALSTALARLGQHALAQAHAQQLLLETRPLPVAEGERLRALVHLGQCCQAEALSLGSSHPRRPGLLRRALRCSAVAARLPATPPGVMAVALLRVAALIALGQAEEAMQHLDDQALPLTGQAEHPGFDAEVLAHRGRILLALGWHDEAVVPLRAAITVFEALGQWETVHALLDDLSLAEEGAGRPLVALAALRQAMLARDLQARDAGSKRIEVLEALRQVERLREKLEAARTAPRAEPEADSPFAQEAARLVRAARTDAVTQLGNRHALPPLAQALERTPEIAYSVALLEIDHFKRVQEQWSPALADAVLREVAGLLRNGCRRADSVLRIGAHELALVLPDCSLLRAADKCEQLRRLIEKHDWSQLAPGLALSASFGVAQGGGLVGFAAAQGAAQARLQAACAAGRNQVIAQDD